MTRRKTKTEPVEAVTVACGVGRVIHGLRTERGWSQDELAARVALPTWTRVQVRRLERCDREGLSLEEALALAYAFGVSVADLLPEATPIVVGKRTFGADTVRDMLTGLHVEETGGSSLIETPDGLLFLPVSVSARSEAVVRAAASLGRTPGQVEERAIAVWGHGLVAERDARLSQQEGADTPASRKAQRGHVMRRLIAELRESFEGEK